jgi:predicted GTPase
VLVCLFDALRPGQASLFHPGEACARSADLLVVGKADAAPAGQVEAVVAEARALNARAQILRAASRIEADRPAADLAGRRVLVLEDGPTLTHGGLPHGAGFAFARAAGAVIVDPRPFAEPPLDRLWHDHPHLGTVLPAVGYDVAQRAALRAAIEAAAPDLLVVATPIDAARLLDLSIPCVRVRTVYRDLDTPGLADRVEALLASRIG